MGINPGVYVFTLPTRDTLTVRFGPEATTPIPLPAGLPLLGATLGLLALLRLLARRDTTQSAMGVAAE